jgi:hypothetical protein
MDLVALLWVHRCGAPFNSWFSTNISSHALLAVIYLSGPYLDDLFIQAYVMMLLVSNILMLVLLSMARWCWSVGTAVIFLELG